MKERTSWARVLQGAGFVLGLGLLGWCISIVFKPDNREQLSHLLDASALDVAVLFACSVGTLVFNGLIFWIVLWPVRRTGPVYVSAVNAVATLISYAPFKIAVAFRVLVYHRIDRIPILTIGAWFAAIAVLALTVLLPALFASLMLPGHGPAWWIAWIAGTLVCTACVVASAKLLAGDRGWERFQRLMQRLGLGFVVRLLGSEHGRRLHAGVDMLAHWRASAAAALLRVADVLVQAVRVWVAAQILHVNLDWGPCMVIASTYFLIGIISPIGMLGPRESGSAAVATLAGISAPDAAAQIVTISLLISASEGLVNLAGGGLGAACLRIDRWLLKRSIDAGEIESPTAE
ncbi:MAG: hypothetical protein Kow0022_11840 [Phycisphaerales bacterium]